MLPTARQCLYLVRDTAGLSPYQKSLRPLSYWKKKGVRDLKVLKDTNFIILLHAMEAALSAGIKRGRCAFGQSCLS